MSKVKITVVKKLSWKEIGWKEQLPEVGELDSYCPAVKEGDEYLVEDDVNVPKGFCSWAWHDISREVLFLLYGGNFPWIKEDGVLYSCCTDGLRPVIFKLERIE